MNVKNDLHTVWSYKIVQIIFNVHNPIKLKILTVNPYIRVTEQKRKIWLM